MQITPEGLTGTQVHTFRVGTHAHVLPAQPMKTIENLHSECPVRKNKSKPASQNSRLIRKYFGIKWAYPKYPEKYSTNIYKHRST